MTNGKAKLQKIAIARRGPWCKISRGWESSKQYGYALVYPVYQNEMRIYLGRTLVEAEQALLALPKTTW